MGGRIVTEAGGTNTGKIAIDQMYVRYMVPAGAARVPVVLVHGATLTGTGYETTPDGRMGWDEYVVRQRHPVYVPDQVAIARSGFNPTVINQVKAGAVPLDRLPRGSVIPQERFWLLWRFGPTYGTPYPDSQFPIEAIDALSKSQVPGLSGGATAATIANLSALTKRVGGAVIVGHSQSGNFPQEVALAGGDVRGIVTIETGCMTNPPSYSSTGVPNLKEGDMARLAKIPTLVVFGDHLDGPSTIDWPGLLKSCRTHVQQLKDEGGDATLLHLPEAGIRGNSHMMMNDKNNLQVADQLLNWVHQHVERKTRSSGQKRQ